MTIIKLKEQPTQEELLKKFIEETLGKIYYLNTDKNLNSSDVPNINKIVDDFRNLMEKANISINIRYIIGNEYSLLIQDENKHEEILNQICKDLQETFDNTQENEKNHKDLNYINENLIGLSSKTYIPLIIMGIIYILNTNKVTKKIIIRNVPGDKKSQLVLYFKNHAEEIETIINNTLYSLYKHGIPSLDKKFDIELNISSKKQTGTESGEIGNYYTITLNFKNKDNGENTY